MANLVISHVQYLDKKPVAGPADTIIDYLKIYHPKTKLFFLTNSLFKGNGSCLYQIIKKKSIKIWQYNFHQNFPNFLRYLIDIFIPLYLTSNLNKFDSIIAIDPLNFFLAYLLKKIGKTKRIIYYTVDYAETRFTNKLLNFFYYSLDQFAIKHTDLSFSASKNIYLLRKKQCLSDEKNIYIPNTPILEKLKPQSLELINRNKLVMVFSNPQGIDFKFLFSSLKELIKKYPNIELNLVGKGNFSPKIKQFIDEKTLSKCIKFIDSPSHLETLKIIRENAIGLECNDNSFAWNKFREPLKIREYMSFGLPVVSKPGHGLESEIEEHKLGFVTKTEPDFIKAIDLLIKEKKIYQKLRKNNLEYIQKLDKSKILNKYFNKYEN